MTPAEELQTLWQSMIAIAPNAAESALAGAKGGGERHRKAMYHLIAGSVSEPNVSPRAGLAHLRQAETQFRSLSMRDLCRAVHVEAALHIREAGFSALALSSLDSQAAVEFGQFAASVQSARALCLLDLGQVGLAAAATHNASRAIANSSGKISLRERWHFELASLQLRVVVGLLKRPFSCHLTEPVLMRDPSDVNELPEALNGLLAGTRARLALDGTSVCLEASALDRLSEAADAPGDTNRGSVLLQHAADFALPPQRIGPQAWLWLGTTELLLGRPKSAVACLQRASSSAGSIGWVRVQRSAQIDLVHAYEQAGQSTEALATHKELRRLESGLRELTAPEDWSRTVPAGWTGPDLANVQNAHLRRAVGLMNHEPGHLNVESLAMACGVSRRTLEKAFRSELGQTVAECLRGRRLAMVETKLVRGADSIKRIALETGYPSASALCHDFKRATGVTPARFRVEAAGRESFE